MSIPTLEDPKQLGSSQTGADLGNMSTMFAELFCDPCGSWPGSHFKSDLCSNVLRCLMPADLSSVAVAWRSELARDVWREVAGTLYVAALAREEATPPNLFRRVFGARTRPLRRALLRYWLIREVFALAKNDGIGIFIAGSYSLFEHLERSERRTPAWQPGDVDFWLVGDSELQPGQIDSTTTREWTDRLEHEHGITFIEAPDYEYDNSPILRPSRRPVLPQLHNGIEIDSFPYLAKDFYYNVDDPLLTGPTDEFYRGLNLADSDPVESASIILREGFDKISFLGTALPNRANRAAPDHGGFASWSVPHDVLELSDINICQVAMSVDPSTNERSFCFGDGVEATIETRSAQVLFAGDARLPARVAKYEARGFHFT